MKKINHLDISRPSLPHLIQMMLAYREPKILLVANEAGLFTSLWKRPADAVQLSRRLDLDLRATRLLLDALVAMGLLHKRRGQYSNTRFAEQYLVEKSRHYRGDNLKYQEMIWPCWSHLGEVVRTGTPLRELGGLLSDQSNAFVKRYIMGMHNIAKEPSAAVARSVRLNGARRMLDVGGGPGTYTMALLRNNPGLHSVILDLPRTLEVTAECMRSCPDRNRIELRAGDYTRTSFGRGFDLVMMSHITHDEDSRTNQKLVTKAFAALRPGGTLAIHDFTVNENRTGPRFAAIFAVNMLVYTKGGTVYSKGDYTRFLRTAGFCRIRSLDILKGRVPNWSTLITAQKPSDPKDRRHTHPQTRRVSGQRT